MTRKIITVLLGFILRVFFRRIEVAGLERVPRRGATMFVLNHPNGLVDPLFILCLAPRRVSFLAKSTLFKMPVIGFLVRALEAIPVYRKQDEGENTLRNRETFEHARALLASGGTIAICPEGISHNEPSLRPLKSGAARIALGAASTGDALDVKIVPAGLYYTAKTSFRSSALLYFGEPIKVAAVALGADGNPPREAVNELSNRVAVAMREATLNAEHHEALATVARAERVFSSARDGEEQLSLARELKVRRRFIEGYAFHLAHSPERLASLEARIRRYEEELAQAGIDDPLDLSNTLLNRYGRIRSLVALVALFVALFPFALAGALAHYPAYRLAGHLATRFSNNYDDVISTVKMLAAALLLPLTWIVLAGLGWWVFANWRVGLGVLVAAPLTGWIALRFTEQFDRFIAGTKVVLFFITRRGFFKQLLAERRAIRREILELGDEAARAGALTTAMES